MALLPHSIDTKHLRRLGRDSSLAKDERFVVAVLENGSIETLNTLLEHHHFDPNARFKGTMPSTRRFAGHAPLHVVLQGLSEAGFELSKLKADENPGRITSIALLLSHGAKTAGYPESMLISDRLDLSRAALCQFATSSLRLRSDDGTRELLAMLYQASSEPERKSFVAHLIPYCGTAKEQGAVVRLLRGLSRHGLDLNTPLGVDVSGGALLPLDLALEMEAVGAAEAFIQAGAHVDARTYARALRFCEKRPSFEATLRAGRMAHEVSGLTETAKSPATEGPDSSVAVKPRRSPAISL